jgi:hypothetical protein
MNPQRPGHCMASQKARTCTRIEIPFDLAGMQLHKPPPLGLRQLPVILGSGRWDIFPVKSDLP